MGSSQTFSESLPSRRQAIERFISGGPQRIPARIFWCLDDLENSVIGWNTLKSNAVAIVKLSAQKHWLRVFHTQHATLHLRGSSLQRTYSGTIFSVAIEGSKLVEKFHFADWIETHLGRNDRNLVIEFPVFINCDASLAIAQCMPVKLDIWISPLFNVNRTFPESYTPCYSPVYQLTPQASVPKSSGLQY